MKHQIQSLFCLLVIFRFALDSGFREKPKDLGAKKPLLYSVVRLINPFSETESIFRN